jgi:hypothetical protein
VKVNVTRVLLDYEGKPIEKPNGEVKDGKQVMEDVTVRSLIIDALNFIRPDENPPPEDRFRSYRLSMLIHDNDEVDLTAEDVTFLKDKAGRFCSPLGTGQCYAVLDEPIESGPAETGDAPAEPDGDPEAT